MIKKYILFTLPTCSKCPAAKAYLAEKSLQGEEIDAGTDEGFEVSQKENFSSTPAAIFYDENGKEVCRGVGLAAIKKCLE